MVMKLGIRWALASLIASATLHGADAACGGSYTVASGDTISSIAAAHGVSQSDLLAANPSVTDPNMIQPGQMLNIPHCGGNSGPAPTASAPTASAPTAPAPTASAPSGGVTLTNQQFEGAITACGFPSQPDSKRINMLASIAQLGGDAVVSTMRELAMYMAQVLHESGGLGIISRGYIQLTGQSNYAAASQALFGDDRLVTNPDLVTQDDTTAWGVTSWYWKTRVHNLDGVAQGHFGVTTQGINGGECTADPQRAQNRCDNYGKVLPAFGLNEAPDCSGCT